MFDIEKLRNLPLFANLADEHLAVLGQNLRPLSLSSGEILVSEGQATKGPLMIVEDGFLEVTRNDHNGKKHTLAMLEPPTVIGELEFLADVKSSATVIAHDDVTGYLLPRRRFEALLVAEEPAAYHLAVAIGKVVSERLAETNESLANALAD